MRALAKSERHAALDTLYPPDPPTWLRPAPPRVLAHCSGACNDSAGECPTKEACHLGEPTVRRFARSTTEAFPRSAEYGAPIEKPHPARWYLFEAVMFAAAIALFYGAFYVLPRMWP